MGWEDNRCLLRLVAVTAASLAGREENAMKKTFSSNSMETVVPLIALLVPLPAVATTQVMGQMLGPMVNRTDTYTFTCPVGTSSARARARETSNPGDTRSLIVHITSENRCQPEDEMVQEVPDVMNMFSAWARCGGGVGAYNAYVIKIPSGVENYIVQLACGANGNVIPTPIMPNPNQ